MKKFLIIIVICSATNLFAQQRTFLDVFPSLSAEIQTAAFSESGHVSYQENNGAYRLLGGAASRIPEQITNNIIRKNPGHIIESIHLFPCNTSNLTMLDIYNALGNIRNLKGILYDSRTREQPTPLFEEATRIVSESRTTAVADPAPSSSLPRSETLYVRLKDVNFGNTFYRGEMSVTQNGLSYSFTNFRGITYYMVSFIRAERFTAQLYIEPVREGVLIYSIAGVDISSFAASRVDVNSAIAKRLGVFTTWASREILSRVSR